MLDHARLTNILASLYKSDRDATERLFDELVQTYRNIQTGLMTSNDFTHIRYLQGAGNVLSSLIVAYADARKVSETDIIVGGQNG